MESQNKNERRSIHSTWYRGILLVMAAPANRVMSLMNQAAYDDGDGTSENVRLNLSLKAWRVKALVLERQVDISFALTISYS